MRSYKSVLVLWVLVTSGSVFAQEPKDTIQLDEVIVEGIYLQRFLPGGSRFSINNPATVQNLQQTLSANTPFYLIEYGAKGQLASLNLRGLGASRTSVLWQGMEINSFTLGQSDFGSIMIPAGSRVNLELGSVSALYGNGALGGSLSLDQEIKFNQGFSLNAGQSVGSFGHHSIQLKAGYSSTRLSTNTSFSYQSTQNDFPYYNQKIRLKQHNAGFSSYALSQDLHFKINEANTVSGHFWYTDFHREIQPHREDLQNNDGLDENNLRSILRWTHTKEAFSSKVSIGFTRDDQLFNQRDRAALNRWHTGLVLEWEANPNLVVRSGTQWNYLIAQVDAYERKITETRGAWDASLLWAPLKRLEVGFNINTPSIAGNFKKITPLLSTKFEIYKQGNIKIAWDGQVGQGYRLPTLNDRYWTPGGNLNLQAERSNNWETGLRFALKSAQLSLQSQVRYFNHHVRDWIIWIPGGREVGEDGTVNSFWFPDNIRKVVAQGLETSNSMEYQFPKSTWKTSLRIQSNYQRVVNKKALSALDRSVNRQLPYTPKWSFNTQWEWAYKGWAWVLRARYQSARFVEANNELPALPGYAIYSINASKSGSWQKIDWRLGFSLNNLFNLEYENFENRAMPGRNYNINLTLNYKR